MAHTAGDIMQTEIVTVSPELSLLDVHRLFVAQPDGARPLPARLTAGSRPRLC